MLALGSGEVTLQSLTTAYAAFANHGMVPTPVLIRRVEDRDGTVLFAGTAAPGITDITPYWRPASWAAGVVVVDALSWGEADDGLIERWASLPEWPQMLLRALIFRLAVHALHPRSTAAAFPGLARTAALVRLVL